MLASSSSQHIWLWCESSLAKLEESAITYLAYHLAIALDMRLAQTPGSSGSACSGLEISHSFCLFSQWLSLGGRENSHVSGTDILALQAKWEGCI